MLDKLDAIKAKFDDLSVALTNPEVVGDNKRFVALSKEYRSLEKIINARNAYIKHWKILSLTKKYSTVMMLR